MTSDTAILGGAGDHQVRIDKRPYIRNPLGWFVAIPLKWASRSGQPVPRHDPLPKIVIRGNAIVMIQAFTICGITSPETSVKRMLRPLK